MDAPTVEVSARISEEQAAAIDAFQANERLATRKQAVQLLLEIALDTVSGTGRRFWDSAPSADQPRAVGPADEERGGHEAPGESLP